VEKKEIYAYAHYDIGNIRLIAGVCGTGKVSAALCAACAVRSYQPDLVVSIGTCGALGEGAICDVIVATDCVQHDYDTSPFWGVKGELTELKTVALKTDETFVRAAKVFVAGNAAVSFGRY
jgi:adenosylhomocysteine nucleosidase